MADFEGYARKEIERAFRRNGGKSGTKGAVMGAAGVKKALNKKRDEEEIAKIQDPLIRRSAEDQYRKAKTGSVKKTYNVNNNQPKSTQKITVNKGTQADSYYGGRQAAKLSSDYKRGQAKTAARKQTLEDRQISGTQDPYGKTQAGKLSSDYRRGQAKVAARNATRDDKQKQNKPGGATGNKSISSKKITATISSRPKTSGQIKDNTRQLTAAEAEQKRKAEEEAKRKAIADAMKNVRRGP